MCLKNEGEPKLFVAAGGNRVKSAVACDFRFRRPVWCGHFSLLVVVNDARTPCPLLSSLRPCLPLVSLCPVLAQLALTLCIHPIVKHSADGDASVLLAGAAAAAIGVVFGKDGGAVST